MNCEPHTAVADDQLISTELMNRAVPKPPVSRPAAP